MKLVNDQILYGPDRIDVSAPVEIIDHDPRPISVILTGLFSPDTLTGDRSGVRIQKWPFFLKNQPSSRVIRSVHPVSILKITDIQPEHDHGIDASDPVMLRKRQDRVRFFFAPVI